MTSLPIASSTALWFLTRGTGVVTLLLLTLVVVLGVLNVRRTQLEGVPRFVIELVHRNAALLAVVFLAVHIITSVLDPFAPISVIDAVLPFHSAYRPVWLGLGAIASDLLLAIVITSLVRRSLGFGTWRAIHWLAYASWPVAVVHGLGTGSDTKAGWMLALTAVCVIVVVVAVIARVASGWPGQVGLRVGAVSAAAAVPIGLLAWLPGGPLGRGWARRSGTPVSVLAKAHPATTTTAAALTGHHGSGASGSHGLSTSFQAPVSGTVRQQAGGEAASVHIVLTIAGERLDQLHLLIEGRSIPGGGVSMSSSSVTLGTSSQPHLYRGSISALQGTSIQASVSGPGGRTIALTVDLQIDSSGQRASGTVTATT
jgi:sulfoxide reductase heme-binding subunit YedZ